MADPVLTGNDGAIATYEINSTEVSELAYAKRKTGARLQHSWVTLQFRKKKADALGRIMTEHQRTIAMPKTLKPY